MSSSAEEKKAPGGPPPPYDSQPQVVHVQASPVASPAASGVMVAQPMVFYGQRTSFRTQCPFCKAQISTRCHSVFSTMDIIMLLVGLLLFFPLICIVACCSPWNDYEHFCPHCGQFLGRSNSMH